MPPVKSDIETSLGDLHVVANSINGGLQHVLAILDDVVVANTDILKSPDEDDVGADLLQTIRQKIIDLSNVGKSFDEKLFSYQEELVELKGELEASKKEAFIDPLTGIANRRKLERTLKGFIDDIGDMTGKLSMLLADVDDFKMINDKEGHIMGDQVLKLVAHAFTSNLKRGDCVGRWAGDEFAAFLPSTDKEQALLVAERIRNAIFSRVVKQKGSGRSLGHISLSIGVSNFQQGDDAESFIHRTDTAMYEAKRRGKNQVVIHEDET